MVYRSLSYVLVYGQAHPVFVIIYSIILYSSMRSDFTARVLLSGIFGLFVLLTGFLEAQAGL